MTQHLTLGDLIDLRDQVAAASSGEFDRFAIANGPGLLSALSTPFQAVFGVESFPSLLEKGAALVFLLIANHPFYDGNKRIAAAALRLFLARNGLGLRSALALADLTDLVLVAHGPRDPRLLAWLEAAVEPLRTPPPAGPSV